MRAAEEEEEVAGTIAAPRSGKRMKTVEVASAEEEKEREEQYRAVYI